MSPATVEQTFDPSLITFARESDRGRGVPFFDIEGTVDTYGVEGNIAISIKIGREDRHLPTVAVAGSKPAHLQGLILAANAGKSLPVLVFNQHTDGRWFRICFDLGAVLREHQPKLTAGWARTLDNEHAREQIEIVREIIPGIEAGRGAVGISPLRRKSGGVYRYYMSTKVAVSALSQTWEEVPHPALPRTRAELDGWMETEDWGMIG